METKLYLLRKESFWVQLLVKNDQDDAGDAGTVAKNITLLSMK
jgi:hypothetical protein